MQPIKTIELEKYYNYFSKYNKNSLIALSQEAYDNNIEIFRLENNNLVKSYIIRKVFIFNNIYIEGVVIQLEIILIIIY